MQFSCLIETELKYILTDDLYFQSVDNDNYLGQLVAEQLMTFNCFVFVANNKNDIILSPLVCYIKVSLCIYFRLMNSVYAEHVQILGVYLGLNVF